MTAPKHPDPQGKMVSYAPGYGPGADGEPVELPPDGPEIDPHPTKEPEPEPEPEDEDESEEEESHAGRSGKKKRQ